MINSLRNMNNLLFVILLSCFGTMSCSSTATGTKQVMSQTGNNRAFPTNKHARVKNKRYKADKSSVRNKQREHAAYQGNEEGKQ